MIPLSTRAFQIQYLIYNHGFDHSTMSFTKHGCAIFESLLSAIYLIIKHRESDQSKGDHTTSTPSHNMPNHDSCILNSQSFFVFFFFFGCFVGVGWLVGWCGKLPFEPELISQKKVGHKNVYCDAQQVY